MVDTVEWAAGLFEGEGSFFINKVKSRGRTYYYPCASLKMTDEHLVRRFHEVVKFGKVWTKDRSKTNRKMAWDWRGHGNDALTLFKILRPFLGKRRTKTALEIFEKLGIEVS